MLFVLLCLRAAVQVLSEAPLLPPQNIHVEKGQLTWTPATEERGVTYSVEYRSFNFDEWKVVPACVQIPFNSCNVAFIKAQAEHNCVMLRVRAERRQLTSIPVEACSRHGDTCTPDFRLTTRPGSLTIHLSRNHSLSLEYADHAKYRIYFGKEGQPLQEYDDPAASVSIGDLEAGQRYCVKVEYIAYHRPVGLPSCIQCEVIPVSRHSKGTVISVAVVVVVILLFVIPVVVYVLLFKRGKIKQWLRPPYEIPDLLESFPEHQISILPSSPDEELCDVVSSITPEEVRRE